MSYEYHHQTRFLEDGEDNEEGGLQFGPVRGAAFGISAGCCAIASLLAFVVISAMLLSSPGNKKKVLSDSFNVYLVFLILPDAAFNGSLAVTSSMFSSYIRKDRGYYGVEGFPSEVFRVFFWFQEFYYFCNVLINAIVTYEIHSLLSKSSKRIRYHQRTPKTAFLQCFVVYVFVALNAFWKYLDVPWALETTIGEGNLPFDLKSIPRTRDSIILFLYYALFFFGPILYVAVINFVVYWNKLLPLSGRTRVLALYFIRIVVLYVAFYVPYFVIVTISGGIKGPAGFWIQFVFGDMFYPLQTFVTLSLVLSKPDVRNAVFDRYPMLLPLFGRFFSVRDDNEFSRSKRTTVTITSFSQSSAPSTFERTSTAPSTFERTSTRNNNVDTTATTTIDEQQQQERRESTLVGKDDDIWEQDDVYEGDEQFNDNV